MTIIFPHLRVTALCMEHAPVFPQERVRVVRWICRRSGLDCPVALGRVKTARRSASALRGLDPSGALPVAGNYRSDGAIWTATGLHVPELRDASVRLQSCALTNHASRPHHRSHDVLVPRLVLACTADDAASGRAWSIWFDPTSTADPHAVDIRRSQFMDEGRTSCLRLNVSFGITNDRPTG
jgi:hypothetical protein